MTLLDRYILAAFARNYLVSFVVLVGMFILLDMVFNFDEFTRAAGEDDGGASLALGILSYYAYQSFFVYGQLAGVIPVLAAAFTFLRMSRFNELTAMLAAGVSLRRAAAPVVIAASALNLVVQPVNQELVIPSLVPQLIRDRGGAVGGFAASFPVRAMPDGKGGIFDATRYHPAAGDDAPWLESLTVISRDLAGRGMPPVVRLVAADRAGWDAASGYWRLANGRQVVPWQGDAAVAAALFGPTTGDLAADAAADTSAPADALDVLITDVTPAELELFRSTDLRGIGLGGRYFDLLSTSQIDQLLRRPDRYGTADLVRAKHARLSAHVMNVVLLLLAIPAVLTRQPGQLRRAAGKTLFLVGSAMAAVFVCQMLATKPPADAGALADQWPALMTWMPVFLFGPLAVLLVDRMKT